MGGVGFGVGGNVGGGNRQASASAPGAPPPPSPTPLQMSVGVSDQAIEGTKLSPEEEKQRLLVAKFHPAVLAVIERLKINGKPGGDEVKFIRGEKAEVQIWLTDKSPEALAKLKELGFEVVLDPKTAKLVIGRLPIENLQKLAELRYVRYVSPQVSK